MQPELALVLYIYTCIWLLHPVPTSAQDGLDPLQGSVVYPSLCLVVVVVVCDTFAFTNAYILVVYQAPGI